MSPKSDTPPPMIPLDFRRRDAEDMRARAGDMLDLMRRRRSVRHFSTEPIPADVLEACIETAAQAPSGANKQPWSFVVVTDPALKRRIRAGAEIEERAFYGGRAPDSWLSDLEPFATSADKKLLEDAPALIAVFAQRVGEGGDKHYYVTESVGLATGFLLVALHHAGLAALTHTPSPMKFLAEILQRPESERPFLLIPVGYPADDCEVPDIERKDLSQVLFWRGPR